MHLRENLTFDQAGLVLESNGEDGKDLYMKGICIQGGVKNANERIYPVNEIAKATKTLKADQSSNATEPVAAPSNLIAEAGDKPQNNPATAVEPLTPAELKQMLEKSKKSEDDDCLMCGS